MSASVLQRLWIIRPGEDAHIWDSFRDRRVIGVGYSLEQSPEDITTLDRAGVTRVLGSVKPTERRAAITAMAGMVWAFVDEVNLGDIVLVPRERGRMVAVGRIASPCRKSGSVRAYVRDVEWIATDIPVDRLDADLQQSLKSPKTVWQPRAPQALARIAAVLDAS
jgi:predicted Mrr-cat superfamily restriction endonuclease